MNEQNNNNNTCYECIIVYVIKNNCLLFFVTGMSPILGKTSLKKSSDSHLAIITKVNATSDPLSKVKWGDLYYNEVSTLFRWSNAKKGIRLASFTNVLHQLRSMTFLF